MRDKQTLSSFMAFCLYSWRNPSMREKGEDGDIKTDPIIHRLFSSPICGAVCVPVPHTYLHTSSLTSYPIPPIISSYILLLTPPLMIGLKSDVNVK